MLDFVMSKMAMIVAALFLILAAFSLHEIQTNALEEEELQNMADVIAKTINDMNALNGNSNVNLTFNRDDNGIYIKPIIGNEAYTITITRNLIFLSQKGRTITSNFVSAIHVWQPVKGHYNTSQFANLDNANREVKTNSGDDVVVIERKQIEVSGILAYHTFVYLS